jgi:hygromycin-B 7''-O-kinase
MAEHRTPFAETRARRALVSAGLPAEVPLTRADSVTNEVFLSDDHVIRVNPRPTGRLHREGVLCRALPAWPWAPCVVATGRGGASDHLIAVRRPGAPLARWWPMLGPGQRQAATRQLVGALAQLHQVPCPPEVPELATNPQLLDLSTPRPLLPIFDGIDRLRARGDLDPGVLRDAEALLVDTGDAVVDGRPGRLVHGDLTLENVLWDGRTLTGLIDFEWSRAAPTDLDLDVLLRFCAYPGAHLPARLEHATDARDFDQLPDWLAAAHPQLFAHPRLLDRLRIYALGFEVGQLTAAGPVGSAARLNPLHPYHRLRQLLDGLGHLDRLRERQLI